LLVSMVTNCSKARFSIRLSHCYIKKATEGGVRFSLRWSVFGVIQSLGSELVGLRQCVRESSSVCLRNQKSTELAVNYRMRKPVFRRVSAVSGVRSLSLYLVVICCISQLVIVICVVIIAIVIKSDIQSESR
jgi:hypothetical protein